MAFSQVMVVHTLCPLAHGHHPSVGYATACGVVAVSGEKTWWEALLFPELQNL